MKTRSRKREDSMEIEDEEPNKRRRILEEEEEEYYEDYEDYESEYSLELEPSLKRVLEETVNEIKRREPNVLKILQTPMRLKDRARLLEYYEIYKSREENTIESLQLKERIRKMLDEYESDYRTHSKFTLIEHKQLKDEENRIKKLEGNVSLKYKILKLNTSDKNKAVIYRKYQEFRSLTPEADEYGKLKSWLQFAVSLPYDTLRTFPYTPSQFTDFLYNVKTRLDEELYGMESVKEQLLIFLNAKLHNPRMKRCSLALVSETGCGKTSIVKVLSEVTQHPFAQISFGGVSHPDFLKGHDYTYVGSAPGAVAKALKTLGCKDGILFFDEYDKVEDNPRVRDSVLEITDATQNHKFVDNYISELTLDLSHIWFIFSMNQVSKKIEEAARMDRLFIIRVDGYDFDAKVIIAKDYILPKSLLNIGINKGDITLNKKNSKILVKKVSEYKSGVRNLEKAIDDIVKKIHFLVSNQDEEGKLQFPVSFDLGKKLTYPLSISVEMIRNFL